MATLQTPSSRSLTLYGVGWTRYTALLRAFSHRGALRLTYDRGELELMTLSHEHESYGEFIGRLVVTLTEELGYPIKSGGSTTFRRRRARRGLEPDNCYWIMNEPRVRGKKRIDLRVDPPPDVAIEIDLSSSSINRMAIYASLGVPEVWRFDGQNASFHALDQTGQYAVVTNSGAFSFVTPQELSRFVLMTEHGDENAIIRDFRTWVRQQIAPAGGTVP